MVTSKCTHARIAAITAALLVTAALAPSSALAAKPNAGDDAPSGPTAAPQPSPGPQLAPSREATGGDAPSNDSDSDADARRSAPSPLAPRAAVTPTIHHSPVSSAPAGAPFTLSVNIEAPHLLKMAYVVYRAGEQWYTLKLLRTDAGYAGTIPAEHMKAPGIAYTLEMESLEGKRTSIFASRVEPQTITVREDRTDVREQALLERLSGRRSVVSATGELIRFGTTEAEHPITCGAGQTECTAGSQYLPRVDDQYWRVEASYTYRPLRTVSEFGFRAGVVRGRSLVDLAVYDTKKLDVGLNYAGANVRFRLADIFHTDLELMGSVTEIGFSTGAGAAILIGDPLAMKFTLGWQTIGFTSETYFGTRFYTRLDLPMSQRVTIAPNVEVTDMPHAREFGVRLLADAGLVLGGGFTLWLRGGYQARVSKSGGPAVGTTLQFGF